MLKVIVGLLVGLLLAGLLLAGCGGPVGPPADGTSAPPASPTARWQGPPAAGTVRGCVGGSWPQGAMEPPQVEVFDASHNLVDFVTAGADGCYSISGLAPGTYIVWAYVLTPGATEEASPTFHSTEFVVFAMPEGEGMEVDMVLDVGE